MTHEVDITLTLTAGLTAALVFGFIAQRLRLSPVAGYLLAGIVIGPFTPGYVAESGITQEFAEIGVILLMFGVGIHLHVRDLLSVGKIAVPGALAQVALVTAMGVALAHGFGWSLGSGVVFGITISVASTVVLLRVLADHGVLGGQVGRLAIGWSLVEDLVTVFALVLLPILIGEERHAPPREVALSVGFSAIKIAALVTLILIVGQRLIPRALRYVAKTKSGELFTLTILVLALGIAVGSAELFGASLALGAFLAGLVVGQSEFGERAASEALPMRDAFAVLFFVSIGMQLDPHQLTDHLVLTAATLVVVVVAKPVTVWLVLRLLRQPVRTATSVALATAQIGELSFILAGLGRQLGVLPVAATQVLVATALVAIVLNPFLLRMAEPAARLLSRQRPHRAGARG